MTGKVCVVTGANAGIGKETSIGLAKLGATVVMVCRDGGRAEKALREIKQQSGSDRVLRLMRRPYNVRMYRALVERLGTAIHYPRPIHLLPGMAVEVRELQRVPVQVVVDDDLVVGDQALAEGERDLPGRNDLCLTSRQSEIRRHDNLR